MAKKLHKNIKWHHATTRVMGLLEIYLANTTYPRFALGGGLPLDTVVIGKKGVLERYVNKNHLDKIQKAVSQEDLTPLLQKFKQYEEKIKPFLINTNPIDNRKDYIEISKKLWVHEITAFFISNFTKDVNTIKLIHDLRGSHSAQHISITNYLPKLYQQISKKINIEEDLLKYCLPDELVSLKLDKKILKRRRQLYVLELIDGKTRLFINEEAKKYIKEFSGKPSAEKINKNIKDFTGNTAYEGKAKGKVVIVLDDNQISDVKAGNILVSPMTRTSFLPAMKKAAAIITDEGGVGCHASIMARELKTPTIVATKIASKVLNNGDIIEISTSDQKGKIKIIKKA